MNARATKKTENLAERIYLQLKQDIFDFRLMPGDRFSENEIAERMGVSRTPVREALFRLQREAYVDVLYRSGWQVKPFDFKYFEELYDVRTILECAAVRKLCEHDGELSKLDYLVSQWCVPREQRLDDASGVADGAHVVLDHAAGSFQNASSSSGNTAQKPRFVTRSWLHTTAHLMPLNVAPSGQ